MKAYLSSNQIHPEFRLNGISFSKKTLKDTALNFEKMGKPHEKAIGKFLSDWLDNASSVTVQSSGSTGTPIQLQLQKQHMANSAMATGKFFELQPCSSALLCLSADFIAGKMMLVRAMVLGLHLDCVAPNSKPLEGHEKKYHFSAMVPLQVENSLNKLQGLDKLIVGGAPVSLNLRKKLQIVNCSVFETYGMTETITHVAVRNVRNKVEAQVENTFKALPNVTFSIDDRNCLIIDAPKISNAKVTTNDMVKLISETEFEWLGRYDNVVNSGGLKLHPELIEKKLAAVITRQFFVAGLPDELLGQKLVLVIEGEHDLKPINKELFIDNLEKYEYPKEVFVLATFVLTKNGKLNRRETLRRIEPA